MELKDKKVILKINLNVDMQNGQVTDESQLNGVVEVIKKLMDEKAKIIILGSAGVYNSPADKLKCGFVFLASSLKKMLGEKGFDFQFVNATRGPIVNYAVDSISRGGKALLLQNTYFEGDKEKNCDDDLAKYWADLGEIFIDDCTDESQKDYASNKGVRKFIATTIDGYHLKK